MRSEHIDLHELQLAIDEVGGEWVAGATAIDELSAAEVAALLGTYEDEFASAGSPAAADFGAFGFPPSCDLRSGGFISPVRQQGACASGIAFAALATAEGTYRCLCGKPNDPIDLSEAHLFYCHARAQGARCVDGWGVGATLDACRDAGVVDEACYPYTAGDQDCSNLCASWRTRLWRITGWRKIATTAEMRAWIATRGPLLAAFRIQSDFLSYTSGIYKPVSGNTAGVVPACCVGYDDQEKYWICKLSWGTEFGEQGYARIGYGECDIENVMFAIEGVEKEWLNNVRVNALWTVNQERNAWVHIQGYGWRRVSSDSDTIVFDMLTQLVAAKTAGRPVNVRQARNLVKEVYVL